MRLAIDAGNTRVKWAFGAEGAQAVVHRGQELRALLGQAWRDRPQPEVVHAVSVAGSVVDEAIRQAVQDCWPGVPLIFLTSRATCCGVRLAYTQPERFGVDRLAALVAARASAEGRPVVVVDAGTAVTLDVLDAQGGHRGGVIMPGWRMLHAALQEGTAGITAVQGIRSSAEGMPEGVLQTSTAAGVAAGVHCMFVGGILRAIDAASEEVGADARLYLTGGDAAILSGGLRRRHVVRPHLVLEGVGLMAQAG